MNWLPIIIGKSPKRIFRETLEESDLSTKIDSVVDTTLDKWRDDNRDKNIRMGHTRLPLIETLYREEQSNDKSYIKDKFYVKVSACGRIFPDTAISHDHKDKQSDQEQIIIGENIFLDRMIKSAHGKIIMPCANIRACYSNISIENPDRMFYKFLDCFIENTFNNLSNVDPDILNRREYELEHVKENTSLKYLGNRVYDIRLIIPSDSRADFGKEGLYGIIRPKLSKLGYEVLKK